MTLFKTSPPHQPPIQGASSPLVLSFTSQSKFSKFAISTPLLKTVLRWSPKGERAQNDSFVVTAFPLPILGVLGIFQILFRGCAVEFLGICKLGKRGSL
jgi:hypothetical protein